MAFKTKGRGLCKRMNTGATSAAGTFRDPEGRLYHDENRILREIFAQYLSPVLASVSACPALDAATACGSNDDSPVRN